MDLSTAKISRTQRHRGTKSEFFPTIQRIPQPSARSQINSRRYWPQLSFPPYAFVPGRHPHPRSDLRGHSFAAVSHAPSPLSPDDPERSPEFLYGIDLFNAGYYWEAHEAWEGLWNASGRTGKIADFLKALIKLAAAGVKAREGQVSGVRRHARRSHELLQSVLATQRCPATPFCGILIEQLASEVQLLCESPVVDDTRSVEGRVVVPIRLRLNHLDPLS